MCPSRSQAYQKDVPPSPPPRPPPPPPEMFYKTLDAIPAMDLRTPAVIKVEEKKPFVFISTFKWEMRKGWDKLIHAYLEVRRLSHAMGLNTFRCQIISEITESD